MQQLKDALKQFGLNDYQSRVYLALLKIGPCTASEVCKETKVPQNRVYSVLDELELKGFVVSIPSKPRSFRAIEPKAASEFVIKERIEQMSSAKETIEKRLENMARGKSEDPMEQFWIISGKSGWDKLHRAILRANDTVRAINLSFSVFRIFTIEDQDPLQIFKSSVSKGVKIKALVPITESSLNRAKKISKVVELRHLNFEPVRFMTIDDSEAYVVLYPHRSPSDIPAKQEAYIILWTVNKDLILELINLFDRLWKSAETFEERVGKLESSSKSAGEAK